jgi:hypothetical protein
LHTLTQSQINGQEKTVHAKRVPVKRAELVKLTGALLALLVDLNGVWLVLSLDQLQGVLWALLI